VPKLPKTRNHPKPATNFVSVHQNLSDALASFLSKENLSGRETIKALASLVGQLSNYREEGQRLFPEIFVFDNVVDVMQAMPNSERVVIGRGPKTSDTLSLALKRCAPLARWGWSIYVRRTGRDFEYGLIRCGLIALSLTASELLVDQGDVEVPVVLIRHISRHTIEISGASQNSLRIHYGGIEESTEDPILIAKNFCSSIVTAVPDGTKQQVRDFYWRIFIGVVRSGHGCLAAVLKSKARKLPKKFADGVEIVPQLDIAAKVAPLLRVHSCEADIRLRAAAALIQGMLYTDGVTVFCADGTVRAYNVFVKGSKRAPTAFGGARRRAFKSLCEWVGHDLKSAFFLSQDGHAEFEGKKK
jgi:hypothetical protein